MLTTHQATETDAPFLADVFLRTMRISIEACRGYWDETAERAHFFEQLQLSETRLIESEGERIGFLMAADSGIDIQLHTLCIAPEHQGRGFGTTTMHALLDDARVRSRGVVLWVLKTNSGARSLYERLGFMVGEETTNHYQMRLVS